MKIIGKKNCIIIFICIFSFFAITDAAAQGFDDPDMLLGGWSIRPMFSLSASADKINIYHENMDPGDEASIIFDQGGTGMMWYNDESVSFEWDLEYGETLRISYEGYESYSELRLINDDIFLMAEDQGGDAAIAVLERMYGR